MKISGFPFYQTLGYKVAPICIGVFPTLKAIDENQWLPFLANIGIQGRPDLYRGLPDNQKPCTKCEVFFIGGALGYNRTS